MNTSAYEKARSIVLTLLKDESHPMLDTIRQKVKLVCMMLQAEGNPEEVDEEALVKDVETNFNIWIGTATTLDDKEDHVIWLPDKKAQIPWRFWRRYERYLQDEKKWSTQTIFRLDQITDSILERLEDPTRAGAWDRRGMVAGNVQSGKTANYTGLICKAVDAGYKLVIVLTGLHNSLRSQTQLRLDEEFLGFDTRTSLAFDQRSQRVGVGLLRGEGNLIAHSLTSSADNGDFNTRVAQQAGIRIGSDPVLLVVKKNKSVLNNLLRWTKRVDGVEDKETGKTIIPGVPLLLIDDEADNASINTNPLPRDDNGNVIADYDVTAINGLIRKLLASFEKSAYVGYTATPFANIFIYPTGESDETGDYGQDLFPRSFIINLPSPSNYIGPARVFGLDADQESGVDAIEPLPVVRVMDDFEATIPNRHKKDLIINELPESLKTAIRSFIMSCAARAARRQGQEHNSMLIHVTRFTAVQKQVAELVGEELTFLQRRLEYGDGDLDKNLLDELKDLWNGDFIPTTRSISDYVTTHGLTSGNEVQPASWPEIKKHLFKAAAKIQVKTINGTAKDILDYRDHKEGLSVIVIGGDKLSRGLTLEGLTVSYYLRASKMYDTLMQMGRWFGYRPGYLDLCRLYTTDELVEWYRYITMASEELRQRFDHMAALGRTPEDYGLMVRTHPNGLLITAVNKMRSGTVMQLSYANNISETVVFHRDEETVNANFEVFDRFFRNLGKPDREKGNYIWKQIDGNEVVDLMQDIINHPESRKARADLISRYIESRLEADELTDWTIALISSGTAQASYEIGGHQIGLIERSPLKESADGYSIRRVVSPDDETIDLNREQWKLALERTVQVWNTTQGRRKSSEVPQKPSGPAIREVRSPEHGLLLIYPLNPQHTDSSKPVMGFAVSFPGSDADPIEYKVNNIYWEQEFGSGAV